MNSFNQWRKWRMDAGLSLRKAGKLLHIQPSFLSHIEVGLQKMPVDVAVCASHLYQQEVCIFDWEAPTYDIRESASWRLLYSQKHGFTFDMWDEETMEWINDGDANPSIGHGIMEALRRKSPKKEVTQDAE